MNKMKIDRNHLEEFGDVLSMIKKSQYNALKSINTELINLYWDIGKYVDKKVEKSVWGESIVIELSKYIFNKDPGLKGFSDKNLWRMRQFDSTYKNHPKLSPLVREISWTNNFIIK